MSVWPPPPLSTIVPIERGPFPLDYSHRIFHMGSCFSQSIGSRLIADQFQVVSSPFGIVYDPAAMADQLDRIMSDQWYTMDDLVHDGHLFHSLDHHSTYSGEDAGPVLERINQSLQSCRVALPQCRLMILTFANTRSFLHRATGRRAANCHQLPSSEWTVEEMGLKALTDRYVPLITNIQARHPALRIMVTISPVRYLYGGMQQNNRSKARLHLLAEALEALNTWTIPAFEILMDELRDYRYYDRDLVHPSALAVDIIYQRWLESILTLPAKELLQQIRSIRRDLNHRLRFPETAQARVFRDTTMKKIETLRNEHPAFPWLFSDVAPPTEPM